MLCVESSNEREGVEYQMLLTWRGRSLMVEREAGTDGRLRLTGWERRDTNRSCQPPSASRVHATATRPHLAIGVSPSYYLVSPLDLMECSYLRCRS